MNYQPVVLKYMFLQLTVTKAQHDEQKTMVADLSAVIIRIRTQYGPPQYKN